ncbi:MAG TPA: hypothetical protein VKB86_14810, partial [Pyrinomonadaceae bacterium]|nr:hypothetical protein [Pyrinomonadaceae bacterium]
MIQSHLIISTALRLDSVSSTGLGIGAAELAFLFILVVGLGIVILIVIGQRRKGNVKGTMTTDAVAPTQNVYQQSGPTSYVKRCPTCKSIFTDESLAFCLSDGSTLERV